MKLWAIYWLLFVSRK